MSSQPSASGTAKAVTCSVAWSFHASFPNFGNEGECALEGVRHDAYHTTVAEEYWLMSVSLVMIAAPCLALVAMMIRSHGSA